MENIDYRKKLEQVLEILDQGEELNMSNYNHDLVRQLNDTFVEAWLFVESALAENTPTSEEQLATPAVSESVCYCLDYNPPNLAHDKFNCAKCNGMRYY